MRQRAQTAQEMTDEINRVTDASVGFGAENGGFGVENDGFGAENGARGAARNESGGELARRGREGLAGSR